MRLNQHIARATGMSRRQADTAISEGRVRVNGATAILGQPVTETDIIILDNLPLKRQGQLTTIALHKPVGYVCSRNGQGSKTVYDLLPSELHGLKPVGRLDKDSSGLLLMTNDGALANELTHPRYEKVKIYEITLDKPLSKTDASHIQEGIQLEDGPSTLVLESLANDQQHWQVSMQEGRNRQIRRTFAACHYTVIKLHRITFGSYALANIPAGKYKVLQ